MSRRDKHRIDDIQAALVAIGDHLTRGELSDGLVYDAVRVRLIEIGEAVKGLSADLLATEPDLPWAQIAGMRDRLAHSYFDTSHAIVQGHERARWSVADKAPEPRDRRGENG